MSFIEMIVLFVVIVILFSFWWYLNVPKNLPPGPKGIPLLGCALHTINRDHISLLEKWTKDYGPLVSFYMGNKLVLVLGNYETIDEALVKQGDVFSGRPQMEMFNMPNPKEKNGLIFTDGAEWKEQRRFALSTLRDFGLGRSILQEKISEEVEHLLEDISSRQGRPFDIQMSLGKAVSNVICSMVFGHRFEDPEFWRILNVTNYRSSQSQITFMSPTIYFPWCAQLPYAKQQYEKFVREGVEFIDYVDKKIKETAINFNASDTPTNYIHAYLKAKSDIIDNSASSFTDTNLTGSVTNLFAAGSETTSTTLRWGIVLMAKHLTIQEKVFNEIAEAVGTSQLPNWEDRIRLPYTEACLLEIQRIANLVPMSVIHRTIADTKLMGYDVPADTSVIPFLWNVLKDPKIFPNPDQFNPNRFLDENNKVKKETAFIPFSAGKRICLGESLARMELFLFFTSMIMRFKFTYPDGNQNRDIKRIVGVTMTPENFDICAKKRQ